MDIASSQMPSANLSEMRAQQPQQPERVGHDNESHSASDFTAILENYRAKSDSMDSAAQKAKQSGGANGGLIAQLSNLYSYSVDTQLLVRAANQVTSGVRQLMSGQ